LARQAVVPEQKLEREVKTMRYRGWVIGALLAVAATTSALARDMTPRQVAEAYVTAWNAHDADAAAAHLADDVTYLDVTVVMQRVTRSSRFSLRQCLISLGR
jgi:hypothetical protein